MQVQQAGLLDFKTYPVAALIECCRAAWLLRSSNDLKAVFRQLVPGTCPDDIRGVLLQRIDETGGIPSKDTTLCARTSLDLSFEISARKVFSPTVGQAPCWWLWADSSPMAGDNWLWAFLHYSKCKTDDDWKWFAVYFHELCRPNADAAMNPVGDETDGSESDDTTPSTNDRDSVAQPKASKHIMADDGEVELEDSDSDVEEAKPVSERTVSDLTGVLCRSLGHHTLLPQALGTRAANLPHKVSSICQSLSFATSGAKGVYNMFQTGISGTFDLGTEYGTADISMGCLISISRTMYDLLDFKRMMAVSSMPILLMMRRRSGPFYSPTCCLFPPYFTSSTQPR